MAEKPDDQVTMDEKAQRAKELYGRGCRNYYVKCYTDAADDLSEACKLFGEVHGVDGDELGEVYLLYAKSLIAVGQDENKLLDVPENEDEDEPAEEDDGDTEVDGELEPIDEKSESADGEADSTEKTNGHVSEEKEKELDQEAGPSSTTAEKENDEDGSDQNEDDGGNLEVAWEVLQNAALIFQRQEEKGLLNLLEVYNEMAGISMENANFALALDDFGRALNTFDCIEDGEKNHRIAAEIHYKIGLCQSAENAYDESVKSFQKAHDILSDVIEKEKAKEQQTEDVLANIKDMEETQQEIMNKITEIREAKADEIEQVKKELAKMYGMNGTTENDGAGCSSSSSSMKSPPNADKPKPTDISHLIKRKKPDTTDVECSPAKKKAIETLPEIVVAVPVENTENNIEESEKVVAVESTEKNAGKSEKVEDVPVESIEENTQKSEKVVEESAIVQVAVDN